MKNSQCQRSLKAVYYFYLFRKTSSLDLCSELRGSRWRFMVTVFDSFYCKFPNSSKKRTYSNTCNYFFLDSTQRRKKFNMKETIWNVLQNLQVFTSLWTVGSSSHVKIKQNICWINIWMKFSVQLQLSSSQNIRKIRKVLLNPEHDCERKFNDDEKWVTLNVQQNVPNLLNIKDLKECDW